MNFKDLVKKDLSVANNPAEFAEIKEIYYNGIYYEASVILDFTAAENRQKSSNDNIDTIGQIDVLLYVSRYDLGFVPETRMKVEIDEIRYEIKKVDDENGQLIIALWRLDE